MLHSLELYDVHILAYLVLAYRFPLLKAEAVEDRLANIFPKLFLNITIKAKYQNNQPDTELS